MRWLANTLAILCALALMLVLWLQTGQRAEEARLVGQAQQAVRSVEQTLQLMATVYKVPSNRRGWPMSIEPAWFGDEVPRNGMLPTDHPWMEIATPDQAGLQHPPVRIAVRRDLAGLWYNPYQGVVRARVPVMVSDSESVRLYNLVNGTRLGSIFDIERPMAVPGLDHAGPMSAAEQAAAVLDPTRPIER
jgi:hypothetical protein